MPEHRVVTMAFNAYNFREGDDDSYSRSFIQIPNAMFDQPQYGSPQLEALLDEGWSIVSSQSGGGGTDCGAFVVMTWVLQSPT